MTLEDVAAEVAQTLEAGDQPTPEAALASIDEPVEGEEVEGEAAGETSAAPWTCCGNSTA